MKHLFFLLISCSILSLQPLSAQHITQKNKNNYSSNYSEYLEDALLQIIEGGQFTITSDLMEEGIVGFGNDYPLDFHMVVSEHNVEFKSTKVELYLKQDTMQDLFFWIVDELETTFGEFEKFIIEEEHQLEINHYAKQNIQHDILYLAHSPDGAISITYVLVNQKEYRILAFFDEDQELAFDHDMCGLYEE